MSEGGGVGDRGREALREGKERDDRWTETAF